MKVHPAEAGRAIGNRDVEAHGVSIRTYGQINLCAKPRDEVLADLLKSIKDRRA
jgi:hypothetical protein